MCILTKTLDGERWIIFKFNQRRIKILFRSLLGLIILSILFNQAFALIIYPGVEFEVENETYSVYQMMVFSSITISDNYIIFNTTGFYINSQNDITIQLKFINSSIFQASYNDLVLQFYANTNTGNVFFNISGFRPGYKYEVRRDSTIISNPIANSSGFIFFSNNIWSSHLFSIYQGNMSSDLISPEISNIVLTSSNPKDTNPSFGWENITCIVTDNVAVDQVKINIVYPNSSSSNISMNHPSGTNTYYYNTSFSQHGGYSYYIWARDTSANGNTSSSNIFSLPPNWDVNGDKECKVLDLTLVSNHYNELGNPGWIREDVDNSGAVSVLDFVLVSNHYDETWS